MKQTIHLTLEDLTTGKLGSVQISVDCDGDAERLRDRIVGQIDNDLRAAVQFEEISQMRIEHVTITKATPGVFDKPKTEAA